MVRWNRLRCAAHTAAGLALAGVMALSVLGGGASVAAQATPPAPSATVSTITVDGVGNVSMAPDTAAITLGVNIFAEWLKQAQAQATSRMNAVIAVLKKAGIADTDIQTSNYSVSVNQNYGNNGVPGDIVGYTINNQVTIIVRDLPKLGALLDQAVTAGANSIWGISFYVNDPTDAAKHARTLAVQGAQQRAQELAAAAGGTLGKILSITETAGPASPSAMYGGGKGAGAPIQAGSTVVSVVVTVTYEFIQ